MSSEYARHPDSLTRRSFLSRTAAGAALGLSTGSGLLSACDMTTTGQRSSVAGPGGIPLARPDRPVTLPRYADITPIASGLRPETGPLELYNWMDYINLDVVKDFERKYNVGVRVTTFSSTDEMFTKISSGAVHFDLVIPSPEELDRLVAGKLLQPLNLDYIPNLKANVWPWLADPWYDRGSRYTVPYTVLSTGIAWRADKLPGFDPSKLAHPYDVFWRATQIKGKVGLLDDERDLIGMAVLRNGGTDVNTEDPAQIATARDSLVRLMHSVRPKLGIDYEKLPNGSLWLHQSWSGNMVLAQYFLPKGTKASVLRYWWPGNSRGVVTNDLLSVLRGAKNPVLAHHFINYLLDSRAAVKNFGFVGFQQPVRGCEPDALIKAGLVPPHLRDTLMSESQMRNGLAKAALSQRGLALWQDAWSEIKAA